LNAKVIMLGRLFRQSSGSSSEFFDLVSDNEGGEGKIVVKTEMPESGPPQSTLDDSSDDSYTSDADDP